jgi:hypothetical protein
MAAIAENARHTADLQALCTKLHAAILRMEETPKRSLADEVASYKSSLGDLMSRVSELGPRSATSKRK